MSTEYPPIVIDGSNFCDEPSPGGTTMMMSMKSSSNPVTIKPSLVSLYLILNNELIHQGDYKSEQIRLVWGDKKEQAMAVGGESMTVDSSCIREVGSGSTRIVQRGARRVKEIHVPTQQEPLLYERDFHNFLIIIQRRA
jgi:hypothetical protein